MKSLEEFIAEESGRDSCFSTESAQAEAELALGMQRQLADRAGITQPALARFERAGRTPSAQTLWRLATALGVRFVLGRNYTVCAERVPENAERVPQDAAADGRFRTGSPRIGGQDSGQRD